MKKILLASLALTTFAATTAMAAPARQHMRALNQAITADSVVSEGAIIGKDPDAYVRFELLRDAASPNQG